MIGRSWISVDRAVHLQPFQRLEETWECPLCFRECPVMVCEVQFSYRWGWFLWFDPVPSGLCTRPVACPCRTSAAA